MLHKLMSALCSMLFDTHYTPNYSTIIGSSLLEELTLELRTWHPHVIDKAVRAGDAMPRPLLTIFLI